MSFLVFFYTLFDRGFFLSSFKQDRTEEEVKGQKTKVQQRSRIDEGHCDVSGTVGCWQTFVEVSQSSWVHEAPAFSWWLYGAVVTVEPTTSALEK